jgi:Zn finger protein HypA/HybF involved in hydrogenase expression
MTVTYLHRTLDQELCALARGASLECLVCGEFVLHEGADVVCPQCGSRWPELLDIAAPALDCESQAG